MIEGLSGRVDKLDQLVFLFGVFILMLLDAYDPILQAILEKDLLLAWVRCNAIIELKQTCFTFEKYFKNNRNLIRRTLYQSELEGLLELLASTSIAYKLNHFVLSIPLDLYRRHFDTSIQKLLVLDFLVSPVLVCIVDDVAEGGSKSAVELNFRFIFFAAGLVHVGVYETLHGVNIQNVARYRVVGVR